MSRNKDILFYSKIDKYSINCINIIIRNNIKNKFNYICIDGRIDDLPSVITKVPTILTTSRNIKTDSDVINYIKNLIEQMMQGSNNQENNNEIQDYMAGNDIYQFIDLIDDNMDQTSSNNKQLKTFSLLEDTNYLITKEAKEGTVVMGGKKDANYTQNIDRNIQDAPMTKSSHQLPQHQLPPPNTQQQMIPQRGPSMPQNISALEAINQEQRPNSQSQYDAPIKNINMDDILAQRQAEIQNLVK